MAPDGITAGVIERCFKRITQDYLHDYKVSSYKQEALGTISQKTGNLSGPKNTSLDYDPLDVKSCSFNMFQKYGKTKITAKFQSLKCVLIEDTKGFKSPQKFRDL